jgi:predicted DsbA family dithiol-disulfide isomerase
MDADHRTIEVYADIWCPFTHVGLTRLIARRPIGSVVPRFRVHPWPLELVNGEPLSPSFVADEISALQASVAPDLFVGFDEAHFPTTTLDALALVESAYRIGLRVGEEMSLTLRSALFEEGRDIADRSELARCAEDLAVPWPEPEDRVAVEDSLRTGRSRGVVGSPHFFTTDGDVFCPTLDIRRIDGRLHITQDAAAVERLVASCFPD